MCPRCLWVCDLHPNSQSELHVYMVCVHGMCTQCIRFPINGISKDSLGTEPWSQLHYRGDSLTL